MANKTLGLISCTSQKRTIPCAAYKMYDASALFKKAYNYCRITYDDTAILSAKYGFLRPEDTIEPYDLTLNDMTVNERKCWAQKVIKQMQERINLMDYESIFFHSGKHYREYLIEYLEKSGINCFVPLEGLKIGQQLGWYPQL